jgi:hypothetical protein
MKKCPYETLPGDLRAIATFVEVAEDRARLTDLRPTVAEVLTYAARRSGLAPAAFRRILKQRFKIDPYEVIGGIAAQERAAQRVRAHTPKARSSKAAEG